MILQRMKIRARFIVMMSVFGVGFAVYGVWSFRTLNELKVNGPVYERIVQSKDLNADVLPPPEYIIESYLASLQLADAQDKARQDQLLERLRNLNKDYVARAVNDQRMAEATNDQRECSGTAWYGYCRGDFQTAWP
ncbi:hypothetical protein [Duganella sp. Root1480D1]|uniref:hypothetical protein n=1 Tax=Duganella sp. Root1480D1 TaxID=1736471 RepID=UPI000716303C|nr:hypothetical protein [Duganella sp. Root1480D1]KQZ28270.1 hypothetical protein ASD58_12650 [Duganella sp. Root1480D1]